MLFVSAGSYLLALLVIHLLVPNIEAVEQDGEPKAAAFH
jgi:hypothetical protein